jgi:phenylalanyl-tRNA synthetase alpha chain
VEQDLVAIERDCSEALSGVDELASLNELRVQFLGRQGRLTGIMRGLGKLPKEERKAFGQAANQVRDRLNSAFADTEERLKSAQLAAELEERIDLTLPGSKKAERGCVHPLRRVEAEILGIFNRLGYSVASGPQVEDDWHNFEALNMPPDHPARDMQDTFYTVDGRLLRTHTSPVQIRTMLANEPPLRIVVPGAVYRCDADVSHSPMFHQVEGLVVDKGITMADLKGTLAHFAREMFGSDTKIRLRSSFFPFTEPSAEVDVSCIFCGGEGCRVCGDCGWIEILGCGMIDPAVFAAVDIDPDQTQGFAFGMGIERIAMLRHRIPDIRLLFDSRVEFLEQFVQRDREV